MVGLVCRSKANLFKQWHSIHKQVNTTSKTWGRKRQEDNCVIKADAFLEICSQHKGGDKQAAADIKTTRRKLCDMIFFLSTWHSKWTKGTADAKTTQFWAEQREICSTADAAFVWHLGSWNDLTCLSAFCCWSKHDEHMVVILKHFLSTLNNSTRRKGMCWQTARGAARQKAHSRAHTVITSKYLNYSFNRLVHNWYSKCSWSAQFCLVTIQSE